ncbi:MAG: RNA-binding transcriptional accessory protein [Bdellovibrionales bacterium]|nr:RNA-binding transcriptional accessory protein [Bdellovibrionales bacterium]
MSFQVDPAFKPFANKNLGSIPLKSVEAVLALTEEGGTVPFIARYRKEKTGNLDEVQIRAVLDCYEGWQEVQKRRDYILKEIEKQGNLTDELKGRLTTCEDLDQLEEIYRPFKRKKKTKATLAREAGLQPLADWIWGLGHGELKDATTLEVKAKDFVSATKGYATYEEALRGAQHILVEKLSNNEDLRQRVREELNSNGRVASAKTPKFKAHSKYEMYGEFSEPIKSLENRRASHRYLALRRGWQEGELKVTIEGDEAALLGAFEKEACQVESQATAFLKETAKIALTVHVIPSITNEIHSHLKDVADGHAISVFADNVSKVLMSSPFGPRLVLGVDPGLRTGCKLALVDKGGHFISHTVMHIQGDSAEEKAKALFEEVLKQVKIEAVAVGNGTGGREAESFLRKIFKDLNQQIPVVMVNESGASIYSASEVARDEFPDLDLTVRGAISIARRLQDPLAELVKIDPKSIGVGQYQHDVSQTKLKKGLHEVVESCVNLVGVNVNTASESLLQYVAGIGPAIARNIVGHRKDKGLFKERAELMSVSQFSTKAFEQAAGFLRIPDGKIFLDRTGIHPERYTAVREMAQEAGKSVSDLTGENAQALGSLKDKWSKLIGEYTFDDILKELRSPGRDPRDVFKPFQFREDIHEVKDLKPDMICAGVVTNVTNFGAFVDIGVHQDGLVHISELADQFVDDPRKVVSPGDQVQVKVLGVDLDKNQIALTMKLAPKAARAERTEGDRQERRPRRDEGQKAKSGRPQGGKRPPRDKGRRPPGKGGGKPSGGKPKPPGKPFNNPFAALTGLKSE